MQSHSSDIDLAARTMADDFGPPIEDCLANWGSFADDDPPPPPVPLPPVAQRPSPRSSPPRTQPRPSPPPPQYSGSSKYNYDHHYYYHGQPPPPPPPHARGYYSTPSPYHVNYYPHRRYPPEQVWSSPPAYDYPPPPRIESPPRKKSKLETPKKEELPQRSPYRSPPESAKNHQNIYRRSPIWGGGGTPNIHMYESFGAETSTSLEQNFSPIQPTFSAFDDGNHPFDAEPLHPKLSLVSVNEQRDKVRTVIRQRRDSPPGYSYFEGFSPPPSVRVAESPMHPYDHRYSQEHLPPPPHSATKRPPSAKRPLFASPMRTHRNRPAPFQPYDYGESRVERVDERKSTEGYYKGRDSSEAPPRPRASPGSIPPPLPPHHSGSRYAGQLTTPRRTPGRHHSYPPHTSRVTPASEVSQYPPPPRSAPPKAAPKPLPAASQTRYSRVPQNATKVSSGHDGPTRATKPPPAHTPSSATKLKQLFIPASSSSSKQPPAATTKTLSPSSKAKENLTPLKQQQQRRNPCNCKKSKCLKLYCECFAAELFCDGCNCTSCHNTPAPEHAELRAKAKKHCKANNPNAFKPRVGTGHAPSPASTHNMGCRCKQSKCLKKYCECFQAGIFCGDKCKCAECQNYQGSQPLIDKRLKMKDKKGAEFAMGVPQQAWKGKHGTQPHRPSMRGPAPSPAPGRVVAGRVGPSVMMRSPPPPHPVGRHHPHMRHATMGHPPHFMGPPPTHVMGPPATVGYSPMGMHPATPAYTSRRPQPLGMLVSSERSKGPQSTQEQRRGLSTPRTPAVRIGYDPHSSKRKRKLRLGAEEAKIDYFGGLPHQPKTTALAIFSFLSNDDLYNAGLVNRKWSKLAVDEELWNFSSLT